MKRSTAMQDSSPVRVALCAVVALWVMAAVPNAQASELAEERASRTVFDTTPPETGTVSAPSVLAQGPIPVSYSGASDEGSGIKQVRLWVRHGEDHPWEDTGLSSESTEGAFEYAGALGDGTYEFALVVEDNAGNTSAEPEGPGEASTTLDSTPPVITLTPSGPSVNMVIERGNSFADPGATAHDNIDGDISDRIVVGGSVDVNTPGTYTLTYDVADTAGNAAEQRTRRVEVLPASSYLLTLVSPASGGIQAQPSPGPDGRYPMGAMVTLVYHPSSGSDAVVQAWDGAQQDPSDANVASVVMDQNRTVAVSLMQAGGAVQVAVSPQSASWTVTDGAGGTHTGTGNEMLGNLPPGAVSIAFNDLEGYRTPGNQNALLETNETVTFSADYEPMGDYIARVPTGLTGRPGETVEVPISLSNRDGLEAYALTLSFDSAALAFEDLAVGGLVAAWGAPTASPSPGSVTVSSSGPTLTGDGGGTVAIVTLRVRDNASDGEYPLTLSAASLNQGGLPVQTQDGAVTIDADRWVWGDVDGNDRADSVDANLILQYVVGRIDQLPMQEAAGDSSFVGPANVKGEDPPTITMRDAHLINSFVRGRISTFPADWDGDGYGPESTDADAPPDKSHPLPPDMLATEGEERTLRTLGTVIAEPGVDIRVPFTIDTATGVWGYLIELQYDPDVLEFRNVSKGALAEPWIEPVLHTENGLLRFAATGTERLSGAGQLSVATFRGRAGIAPSTTTSLTVSRVDINDNMVTALVDADAGAPVLDNITPARGSIDGYGMITLHGANLANVDTVMLGNTPAAHVSYSPRTGNLRVITPPHPAGAVSVTASALGQESTLENAFEFYEPEVHIALEPEDTVFVGDFFQIPVVATARAQGVNRLSFVLNFDADTFARSTVDAVVAGPDAPGLTIGDVRSIGAGRLQVTLEGDIGSGHIATINLVVMSPSVDPDTLVFISDGQAEAAGASKAVSGGSALPGRGRW